ncbi:Carbohydrate esterase family 16 protein [Mycena venus]|uniref:Carbohydrate esterase family 16 protein n=1 Tax=Mycena venus TaxID=2733690 RepID=A0A8H6YTY2_9AGAR|nr:Carbohydrate esterase family 16 protein [Mycena venus]
MTPLVPLFCALAVVLAGSATTAAPRPNPISSVFDWNNIRYMYAFGDSYTFVQGTEGHANFSFFGDAFDFAFTPQQILSNQIIPKNTSSEGSNWIEFLTGCMEGSPLRCTKQLWNFAFAGSDIDSALLPLHHNFTIPLVDQVNQWVTYASKVIPHPTAETLTAWWIGINDTGDTLGNASIVSFPAFWEQEMASYFTTVQKAHDNGLKTHLFINVPAEDRSPSIVDDPVKSATMKTHLSQFNSILANHVTAFKAANADATVMTFDSNAWFNMVLDSPAEFGFTNTTGFCTCADPAGFFWYNTGHPTERVHRLLADAIEAELRNPTFF